MLLLFHRVLVAARRWGLHPPKSLLKVTEVSGRARTDASLGGRVQARGYLSALLISLRC
jgi:hypothetical protein